VLPLLFWTVFGVLFVASCAWVLGVFRLLRALKATRPEVHRRILAPVPWSWTVLYNPVAIGRVIAFVLLQRYDNVCDAKVAGVRSSLRRTLTVLALGWPLLIVLLLAAGPERFALSFTFAPQQTLGVQEPLFRTLEVIPLSRSRVELLGDPIAVALGELLHAGSLR